MIIPAKQIISALYHKPITKLVTTPNNHNLHLILTVCYLKFHFLRVSHVYHSQYVSSRKLQQSQFHNDQKQSTVINSITGTLPRAIGTKKSHSKRYKYCEKRNPLPSARDKKLNPSPCHGCR